MNNLKNNFPLKDKNTFTINCIARYYMNIESIYELEQLKDIQFDKIFILGGGSNVVLPDVFDGLVLENSIKLFQIVEDNDEFTTIKVGGGEIWDDFVKRSIIEGYFGFENLASIPGKVGAAPIQNIGAYGIEQEKYFVKADIINLENFESFTIHKNECNFSYRNSIFKNELKEKFLISYVYYQFPKKWEPILNYKDIKDYIAENENFQLTPFNIYQLICNIRERKLPNPKLVPNSGSFFKNPVINEEHYNSLVKLHPDLKGFPSESGFKLSAAKLIEKAGWKGRKLYEFAKAGVSPNHSLVITGSEGVRKNDIMELSEAIIQDVKTKFGITLSREVNIID